MTPGDPDLPPGDGSLIIAAPSATLEHLQRRADELGSTPLFTDEVIPALYAAALHYGIDPTVMVAQSAHETGFAKFGRAVTPEHHNTCGLKVKRPVGPDDNPDDHMRFPDWLTGAKAHAQHLLAYASVPLPPGEPDLDPRAVWVRPHDYGITRMRQLGGHWAPSPTYGNRVEDMARRLLEEV